MQAKTPATAQAVAQNDSQSPNLRVALDRVSQQVAANPDQGWMFVNPKTGVVMPITNSFTATIAKKDVDLVGWQDMHPAGLEYVFNYGRQRVPNDGASKKVDGEDPSPSQKVDNAVAKFDNLMIGKLGRQKKTGEAAWKAQAIILAKKAVKASKKFKAWAKAHGLTPSDDRYAEEFKHLVEERAALPSVVAAAKMYVEAMGDDDGDDDDLDDNGDDETGDEDGQEDDGDGADAE